MGPPVLDPCVCLSHWDPGWYTKVPANTCRDRFIDYLVKKFPGQRLIVWGVGGMVYCNVAAHRKCQLLSRYLVLITTREVTFDLTRCLGTSANMGVPMCHPSIDNNLVVLATQSMLNGLEWCGRILTPAIRLSVGPQNGRLSKAPVAQHRFRE